MTRITQMGLVARLKMMVYQQNRRSSSDPNTHRDPNNRNWSQRKRKRYPRKQKRYPWNQIRFERTAHDFVVSKNDNNESEIGFAPLNSVSSEANLLSGKRIW